MNFGVSRGCNFEHSQHPNLQLFWVARESLRYTDPMSRSAPETHVSSFEAFLEIEENSPVKHEFFYGNLFVMAGGTDRHAAKNGSEDTATLVLKNVR